MVNRFYVINYTNNEQTHISLSADINSINIHNLHFVVLKSIFQSVVSLTSFCKTQILTVDFLLYLTNTYCLANRMTHGMQYIFRRECVTIFLKL